MGVVEVERIKKDAFDHGYLIAVSNLVNDHGAGTEAEDLILALGITRARLRQLDLEDYDRKPLDRIIRHLNTRKRA